MTKKNITIDFFLIGAARCGTTTLYNYLNNCDDIFLPSVKEPNFFSDVDSPKKEDYKLPVSGEKHHAKIINDVNVYNMLYADALQTQLKGDTSPSYVWDTNVAKKLFTHNPEAKIIISLRHPIDRAYSHYIMNHYTGVDNENTFEEALKAPINSIWGSCNQYLEMGLYYNQVKAYFDVFPKEQIKILIYEDWINNLELEIKGLFEFLGLAAVDSIFDKTVESNKIQLVKKKALLNFLRQNKIKALIKNLISQKRVNTLKAYFFNDNSKEIEKIKPDLRQELILKFKEDIKNLSRLTEINFSEKWN